MKYILLLLISYIIAIRSDVLAVPKSLKQRSQLIGGFGAIVALAAGKYFIDGPTFNEPVSLVGKTVAITGANTGLGKETAIKLSSLGAQTILLCRPSKKTDDAVDEIKKISGNDQVSYIPLDLADMKSIRECARILKSKISKLDILINNAGVMAIPKRETTKNGFEMQLGVNHLGHFLLTNELFDLLKKGNRSRIINVSSIAHTTANLKKDDLQLSAPGAYQPWLAYSNTKLANILFTRELSKRLQQTGSNILSLCCHPGICRTELGRFILDASKIPYYLQPLLAVPALPLLYISKSAKQGAQTQIFLAASQSIRSVDSGKYYDNSAPASVSPAAMSNSDAEWLWAQSELLTGKPFVIK